MRCCGHGRCNLAQGHLVGRSTIALGVVVIVHMWSTSCSIRRVAQPQRCFDAALNHKNGLNRNKNVTTRQYLLNNSRRWWRGHETCFAREHIHVSVLPSATLRPCDPATLRPCDPATLRPCRNATMDCRLQNASIQNPESRTQNPESRTQNPESNTNEEQR